MKYIENIGTNQIDHNFSIKTLKLKNIFTFNALDSRF